MDIEIVHGSKSLRIFCSDVRAVGRKFHTDVVVFGMFKNLKEVFANHWLATTNVDVEHLQVAQLIKHILHLVSVEFAWVAATTAGQTMDALQVAGIGEFPCQTNWCV